VEGKPASLAKDDVCLSFPLQHTVLSKIALVYAERCTNDDIGKAITIDVTTRH